MPDAAGARSIEQKVNHPVWRAIFHDGNPELGGLRRFYRNFPSPPHCVLCCAPFGGIGGALMWFTRRRPNGRNPRYCNKCDEYLRTYPGGAYAEVSILYADIRGSVSMAERMPAADVSKQLNRFYNAVTRALIETDGFVFERQGDSVFGVYPRGFYVKEKASKEDASKEHAGNAVKAAQRLLSDIRPRALDGSPLPFGLGVHTGEVFVCTVGGEEDTARDIGMHGDTTNVAARLSQMAQAGEALISDTAYQASELSLANAERRQLTLKGRSEPVDAWTLRLTPTPHP